MNIFEIETKLLSAAQSAKSRGVRIIKNAWGVRYDPQSKKFSYNQYRDTPCSCVIGAYLVENQPTVKKPLDFVSLLDLASEVLGIDRLNVERLLGGFDDGFDDVFGDSEYVRLGARLAAALNPEERT